MKWRYFFPAILWAAIIFTAISLPPGNIPEAGLLKIPHIDKIVHLFLFFTLSLLVAWAFTRQPGGMLRKHILLVALILGSFYAAFTEIYQHLFLPGRFGSISDFVANMIGTIFGLLVMRIIFRQKIVNKA